MTNTRINQAVWLEKYQRWQIKVQVDGIRKTFTSSISGREGQRECHRKADAWLDSKMINSNTKIRSLLPLWIEMLKDTSSKAHWRQYEGYSRNWIEPVIGNDKICDLTEQKLQSVINSAYSKGNLARKTLSNIRSALFSFIKYCRRSGYTSLKPDDLEIPKGAVKGERTILQPDDIKVLFESDLELYRQRKITAWFIHAFRYAVATGLRPGELISLKKSCKRPDGKILIRESINDENETTHGKNENARRIFKQSKLSERILIAQEAMLKQEGVVSPYLFPARDGNHTTQQALRKAWARYKRCNHISAATPYELRHTFISVNKEMPEGLKKMIVGHSQDMDTEGIYSHEMKGDLEQAAAYIDAAFERILKS